MTPTIDADHDLRNDGASVGSDLPATGVTIARHHHPVRTRVLLGATAAIAIVATIVVATSGSTPTFVESREESAAATLVAPPAPASERTVDRKVANTYGDVEGRTAEASADGAAAKPDALSGGVATTSTFDPAALKGRKIIRTGSIELRVDKASDALRKATAVAVAHGGFLADQQANYDRGADVTVVFRVPAAAFDATLQGLTGLGTLVDAQVSSNEVTAQVVDLQARIASKKAAVDRLRALLATAARPADILAIDNELTTREADIEAMQAQLNGLDDQVALSTITVHMYTPVVGAVDVPPTRPSFHSGWSRGVDALASLAAGTAAFLGAVLPFLPLALVVVLLGWFVARRVRRSAAARASASTPSGAAS